MVSPADTCMDDCAANSVCVKDGKVAIFEKISKKNIIQRIS